MATKLEGGGDNALVAGTLKRDFFCGFPYNIDLCQWLTRIQSNGKPWGRRCDLKSSFLVVFTLIPVEFLLSSTLSANQGDTWHMFLNISFMYWALADCHFYSYPPPPKKNLNTPLVPTSATGCSYGYFPVSLLFYIHPRGVSIKLNIICKSEAN